MLHVYIAIGHTLHPRMILKQLRQSPPQRQIRSAGGNRKRCWGPFYLRRQCPRMWCTSCWYAVPWAPAGSGRAVRPPNHGGKTDLSTAAVIIKNRNQWVVLWISNSWEFSPKKQWMHMDSYGFMVFNGVKPHMLPSQVTCASRRLAMRIGFYNCDPWTVHRRVKRSWRWPGKQRIHGWFSWFIADKW